MPPANRPHWQEVLNILFRFYLAMIPPVAGFLLTMLLAAIIINIAIASVWVKISLYFFITLAPTLITLALSTHSTSRAKLWYAFTDDAINMILFITIPLALSFPLITILSQQILYTLLINVIYSLTVLPLSLSSHHNAALASKKTAYLPQHLPPPLIVTKDKQPNLPLCEKMRRPITLPVNIKGEEKVYDFYTLVTQFHHGWYHPEKPGTMITEQDIELHQATWMAINTQADNRPPSIIPSHIEKMNAQDAPLRQLATTMQPDQVDNLLAQCPITLAPVIKCPSPIIILDEGYDHPFNLADLHTWLRSSFRHPMTRTLIDPLTIQHHPCRLKRDQVFQTHTSTFLSKPLTWHLPALLFCVINYGVCVGLGHLITLIPLHSTINAAGCFFALYYLVGIATQCTPSLRKSSRYYFFQLVKDTSSRDRFVTQAKQEFDHIDVNDNSTTVHLIQLLMLPFMLLPFISLWATYHLPLWAGWSSISMVNAMGLLPAIILATYVLKGMLAKICHTMHEYCLPAITPEETPKSSLTWEQQASIRCLEIHRGPFELIESTILRAP